MNACCLDVAVFCDLFGNIDCLREKKLDLQGFKADKRLHCEKDKQRLHHLNLHLKWLFAELYIDELEK